MMSHERPVAVGFEHRGASRATKISSFNFVLLNLGVCEIQVQLLCEWWTIFLIEKHRLCVIVCICMFVVYYWTWLVRLLDLLTLLFVIIDRSSSGCLSGLTALSARIILTTTRMLRLFSADTLFTTSGKTRIEKILFSVVFFYT